ncbi:gluconolactonase [Sphingobium sp. Sx8-8]|uniref:YncE family protein n=1 Tax=Sphingobium sp. Sx8-8 TaxID=2933617 RepID=UPI001F584BB2|nr:gluconolactonase [Sphingobium sp. Sx8-8]
MRSPVALLAALLCAAAAPATAQSYSVTGSIAGPDGPWDYAQVDPAGAHLYVARGEAVTVVDLASGTVSSIGSIQRGHAAVPLSGGRLLVTSGTDGTVRFLNAADGRELAKLAVGKKPDAAILDHNGHAYVMNADSGTVSVIDTTAMKVMRTIQVKEALEYGAIDGTTLFINNEDAGEIDTVDLAKAVAGKPIALPGCEAPSGLALDASHHRLISACANGKAAIVDARARKLTALVDIGVGPDAVILDAMRNLAFIPAGKDGLLDIFSLASPTKVEHVGRVTTQPGARTGALDPKTGIIYLPTAKFGPPTQPGGRPVAVPGSFHILVVKPS